MSRTGARCNRYKAGLVESLQLYWAERDSLRLEQRYWVELEAAQLPQDQTEPAQLPQDQTEPAVRARGATQLVTSMSFDERWAMHQPLSELAKHRASIHRAFSGLAPGANAVAPATANEP